MDYKKVAPRAGAWIEINLMPQKKLEALVAPRAGAWIEITLFLRCFIG